MNDRIPEVIWTIASDETGWSSWAEAMADAQASPFMNDMIANHKTPQRNWAVDVGCGTGRAFLPLVEAGYRVIGLDPNLDGIHLSLQRANHARLCAYPVLASAIRFPMSASSVTFVVAISTLFHLGLTELISALQEIHRVLIPGGKAVLHFLDLDDWRHTIARRIRPEAVPIPGYQAIVTCFCSQGKIQEWIAQAGFTLETLELKTNMTEAGQQRNWLAHCTK